MEPSFLDAFKANPLPFLAALLFGSVAHLLLLVAALAAAQRKPLGVAAAAVGLVAILTGVSGTMLARKRVDLAASAPGLTENDRARLRAYGNAESAFALYVGLGAGILPLLGGAAAAFAARRSR